MTIKTEYLIDEGGHRKSVVLSLRDYGRLLDYLEDLEDSIDLKEAKRTASEFKEFDKLVHDLKLRMQLH